MKDNWPGGLTVIYKCRTDIIGPLVRGTGLTLGVRMPDHDEIREIIRQVGVPVLGPSANFHSDMTPYEIKDLNPDLVKLVDLVLDGTCTVKLSSTVIDCSVSPWRILRQGKTVVDINKYD
ncbi:hypothetical protein A2W14_01715 [Candidatus Gottesmanbacteria bacterium RBG_16_37_8]|uniref:L-threonylcarbamoyladenylate synthase n=1 Tax=Candidatus Gottesmanbacteria bacterium RBG_16_37_8 TaxID=1798371 RepID=A0A1F5YR82_9BACT|nr:MAG: hypothetical protein A2W14_01715 [Candidatus Gottesmanbacteria bacterium RBG_16_37_8]